MIFPARLAMSVDVVVYKLLFIEPGQQSETLDSKIKNKKRITIMLTKELQGRG